MRRTALCAGMSVAVIGGLWVQTLREWPAGFVILAALVWGVLSFRFALGVDDLLARRER